VFGRGWVVPALPAVVRAADLQNALDRSARPSHRRRGRRAETKAPSEKQRQFSEATRAARLRKHAGPSLDGLASVTYWFLHTVPVDADRRREDEMNDRAKVDLLREVANAFNRHDLEAILEAFSDECVFESPRGPDPWGKRFVGKAEVREGLAARFAGIPDVHYGHDEHFACGDRGVSEWTLTGTTTDGEPIEVRGCDLWTFDTESKISRKDSFWKIRQS
jgi:ketosteroid isomerase-like protein